MLKFPKKLSEARILISNDDGIHSEGIKALEEIARKLTPHVWVVAPENQQSAAGHSLTIHMPLRVKRYDENHISVYGTPTDSVLVGCQMIMKKFQPDIVLSGINHGQNTADDVTYSGTIAAAIEATLMGVPAIAFSQDFDEHGGHPEWDIARKYVPKVLQAFEGREWEDNVLMSVNLPMHKSGVTPEVRVRPQGHYSIEDQDMVEKIDPRGRPYYWVGAPPKRNELDQTIDVGSLKSGHVTITPLSLNLTHHPTLEFLGKVFK
ncbi:MAG: 5'/3'-nucleotidase SurE [Alphaproteobacteria bacterium]|nr:5'/3'-nucleotidase SurE [Alphaproteobacteria bacterium]MDE2336240.1 5'/3'-nucleotidase SurE [Alphaproteobacteria bacterium]